MRIFKFIDSSLRYNISGTGSFKDVVPYSWRLSSLLISMAD